MPATVIRIRTWACPACGYQQDFDPDDAGLMTEIFPDAPLGDCPACSMGKNPTRKRAKVVMVGASSTMTVMGAEAIEDEIARSTPARRFERREHERAKRGRVAMTPAELAASGPAEIAAYRADRLLDIAHAIAEARKREYMP